MAIIPKSIFSFEEIILKLLLWIIAIFILEKMSQQNANNLLAAGVNTCM